MTPAQIAAAMIEAYRQRYENVSDYDDPLNPCLAAALRALPPDADLAAVIDALEAAV
jgi:hypothetical protein